MSTRIVQCDALVLRNLRYGDTSRIATLFTRELGKMGVIAKGVRDPKNHFGACLEILSRSTFVLYYRPGRELQMARSGFLEREFRGVLIHPARYVWACACAEFLDRVLLPEEPLEPLFHLALRGLEVMEGSPSSDLPELFRAWQLRAVAILGYAPRLERCLRCDRAAPLSDDGRGPVWTFPPEEGGVLCPDCRARAGGPAPGIELSPRALRRLRTMVRGARSRVGSSLVREDAASNEEEVAAGRPWTSSPRWRRVLAQLVEEFLRYHLESYRGLRSLEGTRTAGTGARETRPRGPGPPASQFG